MYPCYAAAPCGLMPPLRFLLAPLLSQVSVHAGCFLSPELSFRVSAKFFESQLSAADREDQLMILFFLGLPETIWSGVTPGWVFSLVNIQKGV